MTHLEHSARTFEQMRRNGAACIAFSLGKAFKFAADSRPNGRKIEYYRREYQLRLSDDKMSETFRVVLFRPNFKVPNPTLWLPREY